MVDQTSVKTGEWVLLTHIWIIIIYNWYIRLWMKNLNIRKGKLSLMKNLEIIIFEEWILYKLKHCVIMITEIKIMKIIQISDLVVIILPMQNVRYHIL